MIQALVHEIQLLDGGKLDINKQVNIPISLNDLKIKVDDLDVGKLKTAHTDFKKLNNVVNKEVIKNTKLNNLNTKVNILENKMFNAATLICIKTDKQVRHR